MIIATAPGRCGIVGNPTDMYGGSVISLSTEERSRCSIEHADALRLTSLGTSAVIRDPDDLLPQGDCLDLGRAVLRYFAIRPDSARFHLRMASSIPMQAGLAGSTALVVAAVGALNRYYGFGMDPWALAETARKIEHRVMGVLCGFQDQHMAVFGGLNYMDFAGKESLTQADGEPLATVEPLGSRVGCIPVIAVHTGIQHHSGTVHRAPRERWLAGEECVVRAFHRIAELARLGKRALLSRDWPALGELMNENHALVAEMGGSGPANEALIAAARSAGAWGAKLAGAGGGGTVVALAEHPERVANAMVAAGGHLVVRPAASQGLNVTETLRRARTDRSWRIQPAPRSSRPSHAEMRAPALTRDTTCPPAVPAARQPRTD